jgi:hypothetical protein
MGCQASNPKTRPVLRLVGGSRPGADCRVLVPGSLARITSRPLNRDDAVVSDGLWGLGAFKCLLDGIDPSFHQVGGSPCSLIGQQVGDPDE